MGARQLEVFFWLDSGKVGPRHGEYKTFDVLAKGFAAILTKGSARHPIVIVLDRCAPNLYLLFVI
eukprot:902766-Pyramimonas_sp.AAC.1